MEEVRPETLKVPCRGPRTLGGRPRERDSAQRTEPLQGKLCNKGARCLARSELPVTPERQEWLYVHWEEDIGGTPVFSGHMD